MSCHRHITQTLCNICNGIMIPSRCVAILYLGHALACTGRGSLADREVIVEIKCFVETIFNLRECLA